jgi:probable addiction module antidote protein
MKKTILKHTTSYQKNLIDALSNSEEATAYLKVALEEYETDKDEESFLLALRNVAQAQGGISILAKKTHLNRQNLYRALSKGGNPTFQTLDTILHGLGFRLSIEPLSSLEDAA